MTKFELELAVLAEELEDRVPRGVVLANTISVHSNPSRKDLENRGLSCAIDVTPRPRSDDPMTASDAWGEELGGSNR